MSAVIAHATDRSGEDEAAFVHACALAAASGASLVTIHAGAPGSRALQLPDAAPLAARWGRPIAHRRVSHECCDDVTDTLLDAIRGLAPQLVVVGTHARHGLAAFARDSIGAAVARNVEMPVLIVPNDAAGVVDAATGAITLRELVVPAGSRAEAQRGIAAARSFAALVGLASLPIEVVHAGTDELSGSELDVPIANVAGPIEAAIIGVARARPGAAIVMLTQGHDGLRDVLVGSHTEHVIRDARLPVLSVRV
jgi:nucleotide-binding universal stress UspA family protein